MRCKWLAPLCVIAFLGADSPLDDPKFKAIETKYAAALEKIESTAATSKAAEQAKLVKAYQDALKLATKANEQAKIDAIKKRLEELGESGAAPSETAKTDKPKNIVKYGGHSYAAIPEKVTWHIAKRKCEAMGGHLVMYESREELFFLSQLCGTEYYWLGATDEEKEGEWKWVNGKPATINSPHVNTTNAGLDHWLCWDGQLKEVNDVGAGTRMGYVCEWDR